MSNTLEAKKNSIVIKVALLNDFLFLDLRNIYNYILLLFTALPPPGPIQFSSVKPDSLCLQWGCPDGLSEQQKFWVTWKSHTAQRSRKVPGLNLKIQDLSPGVIYDITVATLGDHGGKSQCVSAVICSGKE